MLKYPGRRHTEKIVSKWVLNRFIKYDVTMEEAVSVLRILRAKFVLLPMKRNKNKHKKQVTSNPR